MGGGLPLTGNGVKTTGYSRSLKCQAARQPPGPYLNSRLLSPMDHVRHTNHRSLGKLLEMLKGREARPAVVPGAAESRTRLGG